MPTARVASVTIGINDYVHDAYRRPGFALRYAVADAEAFHAYLTDAWPANTGAKHVVLRDREATRQDIAKTFARLAQPEPYALLIVYLAGHGEVGNDGRGWFCAADTGPGHRGLGPSEFDELLGGIRAEVTILMLDCCYAESVITSSAYFRTLGDARGKLFLCSARHDQLTFEDDEWGHGALSFVLLNALAADSSLPKTDGALAVEGTLFPYLCEQLPLLVFREKGGAKQEPVMGAVSAGTVRLPAGSTGLRRRDATIFEVVRARYRQVLAATAAVAIIATMLNQLLLYHFAVGVDGYIQVRRGLAPLYWATIPGYELHVETQIDQSEITPLDIERAALLRSGGVWGVWTQKNAVGLRRWSEKLSPFLSPPSAERLALLTGKGLPESAVTRDRFTGVQWRPDTVADASLLDPATSKRLQASLLSSLPDLSGYDYATAVDNRLDFTLLNMSSRDILFYLDTLRGYFEQQNKLAPELVESARKLVSYRGRHLTRRLVGEEFETAAAEYRALLRLLDLVAAKKLTPAPALVAGWCEPAALAHAALSADDAALPAVVERLLAAASPEATRAGDLLTFPQLAALDALEAAARRRRLPDGAARGVYAFLKADGRGLEGHPSLVDWLRRVATLQPLPVDLVNDLQAETRKDHPEFSLIGLRSFDLLARNAAFAPASDRAAIEALVAATIERHKGTSELASALGYLGCAGLGRQHAIAYLGSRVDDARLVRPNRQKVLGFDVIQAGDDFAEGVALGRIAQTANSDNALLERIRRFAMNRLGAVEPAPIVRALAVRGNTDRTTDQLIRVIARDLGDARFSVRRQQLEVAVGAEKILLQPTAERARTIGAARSAWLAEREPDLKMSWATLFLEAQKRASTYDARPCL